MSPDEVAIRQLVQDFAVANRNVDDQAVMDLLCPDEAQDYADFIGESSDPDDRPVPVDHVDIDVTDVVVEDPYASAVISDQRGTRPLFFQRVEDRWTVCQSAEGLMGPAGPTTD